MGSRGGSKLGNDGGAVALIVVLCFFILFGIAALVVDGGALYLTRRSLQNAADAAARTSVVDLPDLGAVQTTARHYAQDNHQGYGTILHSSDIEIGNWDGSRETFTPGGAPLNAVRITTRRELAHGNPVEYVFGPVFGRDSDDVTATAIAMVEHGGKGVRFLIDDEMIDKDVKDSNDVEVIEELAACAGRDSEDVISDLDGDWFIDLYDSMIECGQGVRIELPTGQGTAPGNQDAGLMEVDGAVFPYGQATSPTLEDFLNFNEDGSWRNDVLGPDWASQLDPLLGAAGVWDDADYPNFVSDAVLVSPVYASDISNLVPGVGAKGMRRGLIAFKIIATGPNPPGSVLPWITIELVDPDTVDLSEVVAGDPGNSGPGRLVR